MERKIVDSYNVEFGYELIAVLPYAYYLHRNGLLKETISGFDTGSFYYFSPKHTINPKQRHWDNYKKALIESGIPNIKIHTPYLNTTEWLPPKLKDKYFIAGYRLGKNVVVISNKRNIEWGEEPINTFSIDDLKQIFDIFKNYTIVYNDTSLLINNDTYDDTVGQLGIPGIRDFLNCYSNIVTVDHLCKHWGLTYNKMQLMLYPHVDLFISMQGGSSIFASYYGTKNIIFAKEGRELECGSYNNWYHLLGGSKIIHVDSVNKLLYECKKECC